MSSSVVGMHSYMRFHVPGANTACKVCKEPVVCYEAYTYFYPQESSGIKHPDAGTYHSGCTPKHLWPLIKDFY